MIRWPWRGSGPPDGAKLAVAAALLLLVGAALPWLASVARDQLAVGGVASPAPAHRSLPRHEPSSVGRSLALEIRRGRLGTADYRRISVDVEGNVLAWLMPPHARGELRMGRLPHALADELFAGLVREEILGWSGPRVGRDVRALTISVCRPGAGIQRARVPMSAIPAEVVGLCDRLIQAVDQLPKTTAYALVTAAIPSPRRMPDSAVTVDAGTLGAYPSLARALALPGAQRAGWFATGVETPVPTREAYDALLALLAGAGFEDVAWGRVGHVRVGSGAPVRITVQPVFRFPEGAR